MAWDPATYLTFDDLRLRPGLDLLARVPDVAARRVVDLGCGPGNLTRRVADRFPDAEVVGVDHAEEMLDRARADDEDGRIRWVRDDIATWQPDTPPDVLFSNAALHWLGGHERLVPRLLDAVAPGGVLAVQMPRNHGEPSHAAIVETVMAGPWRDRLLPRLPGHPVARPGWYHELLSPLAETLDVWETVYLHALTGEDPVLAWTRGSVLRPLLALLDEDEREEFLAAHAARLRAAYPPRPDGVTEFPFRRLFLVARRR